MGRRMTTKKIRELLNEEFEEILTMDGYDDAIVGVVDLWAGHSRQTVVCYDFQKCVELLLEDSEMSRDDAEEYLEFNCLGAYMGELTPVFLHDWRKRR